MKLIGSVDLCFATLDESGDRGKLPDDVPQTRGVVALPCEMRVGGGEGTTRGLLVAVPSDEDNPYLRGLAREGVRALGDSLHEASL